MLLQHHRHYSTFLSSLHTDVLQYSQHMASSHKKLSSLGAHLHQMYRLKEREERKGRAIMVASPQSSAALSASLFDVSSAFAAHTSHSSHLYSTLLQQRLDQFILPWLSGRMADSARVDALIAEDSTRWARFEHYSVKVGEMEVRRDDDRKDGRDASTAERERYERNLSKLARRKAEYDACHAELMRELMLAYELRFSFLDSLLLELVKGEQGFHTAMHQQLLPVMLRVKEMMTQHGKHAQPRAENKARDEEDDEERPLPASEATVLERHPTMSQAAFPMTLSLPPLASHSLHASYTLISRIGAGAYGSTLLCSDRMDESVHVMKRMQCRSVEEVNRAMGEAMAMMRVKGGKHVVQVREVFVEEGEGEWAEDAEPERGSAGREGVREEKEGALLSLHDAVYEGETTDDQVEGRPSAMAEASRPILFTVCIVMEYYSAGDLSRRIGIEASRRRSATASAAVAPPSWEPSLSQASRDSHSSSEEEAGQPPAPSPSSRTSSLPSSIAGAGGFPPSLVCRWMYQLCVALRTLHEALLIHRDVKPDNLFLHPTSSLVLGDFGIVHALLSPTSTVRAHIGTPAYLAPEVMAEEEYGVLADVWSAGCVMWELCTLNRPAITFRGVEAALAVVRERGYGEALVDVLSRMLTVDPKNRVSAKDSAECLMAIAHSAGWQVE